MQSAHMSSSPASFKEMAKYDDVAVQLSYSGQWTWFYVLPVDAGADLPERELNPTLQPVKAHLSRWQLAMVVGERKKEERNCCIMQQK